VLALSIGIQAQAAGKQTLYNSPYVTWSPTGEAWTLNYLEYTTEWHNLGETVYTGIPLKYDFSAGFTAPTGMHAYEYERYSTEIPVYKWEVCYGPHTCIHSGPSSTTGFCGLNYVPDGTWNYNNKFTYTINCYANPLPSGWMATCADCGQRFNMHIYATKNAIESIDYLNTTKAYFYICPWDGAMEQGSGLHHTCTELSYNMYEVRYSSNAATGTSGHMSSSRHIYNNANVYEGEAITPQTSLNLNNFTNPGYTFECWNTKPDGSGQSFADGAEVLNLATGDINLGQPNSQITLYAQWKPCTSKLEINPNGGAYKGSKNITTLTGKYLDTFTPNAHDITPPEGVNIHFDTHGGNPIADIKTTMHFDHWEIGTPLYGKFYNNTYTYGSVADSTDRLTAYYDYDSFILPSCSRPGYQFSGWFYDAAYTKPVGPVGSKITPTTDVTIHACWASLTLQSLDNYSVDSGKGAADLNWQMKNASSSNTYKLYRSGNKGSSWTLINTATDIQNGVTVNKSFTPAGTQTYTVPYTGLYTLTASGAQGQNFSGTRWDGVQCSHSGGKGGTVSGTFWLVKGEKITYSVGNRNGSSDNAGTYKGGASNASIAGSGGGATYVYSDKKGILLIAAGGGGASLSYDGGAGGVSTIATSTSAGQSGGVGGGGGYRGGSAGSAHTHRDGAGVAHNPDYIQDAGNGCFNKEIETTDTCTHTWAKDWTDGREWWGIECIEGCSDHPSASSLQYAVTMSHTNPNCTFDDYPDGESDWECYQGCSICGKKTNGWCRDTLDDVSRLLSYSVTVEFHTYKYGLSCTEPVASPSYGGTNYINTTAAYNYTNAGGNHAGNGSFTIQSKSIGYTTANNLNAVEANDHANPNAVDINTVTLNGLNASSMQVTWQEPKDNGTEYTFKAEAYLIADNINSQTPVESNWVSNTLTSGVAKYYVLVDTNPLTIVNAYNKQAEVVQNHNGGYHSSTHKESNDKASYTVPITTQVQYLHIAPVDVVGNLGPTTTVKINLLETDIPWPIYTNQITIDEKDSSGNKLDNVYKKPDEAKTYYVRADGITPFTLTHKSYLDGYARLDYMINQPSFNISQGTTLEQDFIVPLAGTLSGTANYDKQDITSKTNGDPWLKDYALTNASRTNQMKNLQLRQAFTISPDHSGNRIELIPQACINIDEDSEQWSNYELDKNNGIVIIPDAVGPKINIDHTPGVEIEAAGDENLLIDRKETDTIELDISADDQGLSGVRELIAVVTNEDNFSEYTFTSDPSGHIKIDIVKQRFEDKEYLFSGDFTIKIIATDNVGNISEKELKYREFALLTKLVKMPLYIEDVAPDGLTYFRCGESGMLIVTTFGYADKVVIEYPQDLLDNNPHLSEYTTFVYSNGEDITNHTDYKKTESPTFMLPIHVVDGTKYEIIVHAYKKDKELTDTQRFAVISGTVLDDLQTELK